MPDKLDAKRPVQVVLHFHGWGFRQEKGSRAKRGEKTLPTNQGRERDIKGSLLD